MLSISSLQKFVNRYSAVCFQCVQLSSCLLLQRFGVERSPTVGAGAETRQSGRAARSHPIGQPAAATHANVGYALIVMIYNDAT